MRASSEAGVAIRPATDDDATFIRGLAALAFAEYDPTAARTTARMMREEGAETLLAQRDGDALGFVILCGPSRGVLAINAIAVMPSERGRRVGRRLMQAAEAHARKRGVARVSLNTAQANLAALDLFLRCGYVIVDRQAARYWRGQPACRLEKRLR